MKNEEIITFLRSEKANDPLGYERHMTFYKEKYPDLYNNILKPELEPHDGEPRKPVKLPPPQINPAEMFSASDVKPIGSAEVGEVSYGVQASKNEIKKPNGNILSSIQRTGPNWVVIGAVAGLVVLVLIIVSVVAFVI